MRIENILYEMEGKCEMDISAPSNRDELLRLEGRHPKQAKYLKALYLITNGVEINVPGTILYPIAKVLEQNGEGEPEDLLEIGATNFGDRLLISSDGKIKQLDHETGEDFLEWGSLEQFLLDELSAL